MNILASRPRISLRANTALVRLTLAARKIITSRTVSIIGLSGLAALIAGFRLATQGSAEGEDMFRAWMAAWAVIWFALAGVCLRLLKPLYDFFVTDQIALLEAYHVMQMRRLQPGFDQELRSLGLYQQYRDEQAAEADVTRCEIDRASTFGGLSAPQSDASRKDLQLGSRVASII
jgi:hypothetical protein